MPDPDPPPDYQHPDENLAQAVADVFNQLREADWWGMRAGDDEYESESW